jgi:hydroxyacylglutathione hydrolase
MIDGMQHNVQIIPIPAFKDNYIWLIHNGQQALVVDPGDAIPVLETLKQLNLTLITILITHHHHDHIDGVERLQKLYPYIKIYAPKLEQYDFNHTPVNELNTISVDDLNLKFSVISLPGHTLGHVAYYAEKPDGEHLLFCGDTLFGAGCGRIFEGTPAQMYKSLQKLASLPPTTQVYCTHEYTLHNINFALTLESKNPALRKRYQDTKKLRDSNLTSLPSSIALELATNPFLRCHSAEIQSALPLKDASLVDVFTMIRDLRNHY